MKLRVCLTFAGAALFLLCLKPGAGVSSGTEIATVNGDAITSDEFLMDYRIVSAGGEGSVPDTTLEGRKTFLDRVVAKHLLSQYFTKRGWDTLSVWDTLLLEYNRGQYLQALYYEAIPEARAPGLVGVPRLMELSRAYVDSLQKAYDLVVDQKAVTLMADRSVVRRMEEGEKQPRLVWADLFTDEEKATPVARMRGGELTLGEFVAQIDKMPDFARPTGGNTDQISLTVEHFGREKIFELEFNKLDLREKPFFRGKVRRKIEELVLNNMFMGMEDTVTVTPKEIAEYYESHRDEYMTVPMIRLAVMSFSSEDVARQAAKKLEEGRKFEDVAVDFSVYSGSEAGFDTTGLITKDKAPALFDAIWEKTIGSTSGPIPEGNNWKIAKLMGRQDPRLLTLEEATPMIDERLSLLKADEALTDLLAELRSQAKIVVDERALAALVFSK